MRDRLARGALMAAVALAGPSACRPSASDFYGRVFECAGTLPGECGVTADDAPMTCFPATQLGAEAGFCAPACDGAAVPGPDRPAAIPTGGAEDRMCVTTGASLLRCHPSNDDVQLSRHACPPGLGCMRTDLLTDEGVCTTAPLCYPGMTCQTHDRPFCGGDLLALYFKPGAGLRTDHLPCVKAACHATGSACPSGEMCLPDVVHAASAPPDLCMPGCVDLRCPPNYECWQRLSAAGPPVCVPALAGVRCADSQDCLVGDCLPIGEDGFTACTIPCTSDDQCTVFDGSRGGFVCEPPTGAGTRYCISDEIFTGTLCTDDTQCRASETCIRHQVSQGATDIGYCQLPCRQDGTCRPRAGIPHACLNDGPIPYCFPGKIGVRCQADGDCVGDLSCHFITDNLDATDQAIAAPVCTHACVSDDDCRAGRFTPSSWCNGGFCASKRGGDRVCPRDGACSSGTCAPSQRTDDLPLGLSRCTQPSPLSL
jgi:hypothetical protein